MLQVVPAPARRSFASTAADTARAGRRAAADHDRRQLRSPAHSFAQTTIAGRALEVLVVGQVNGAPRIVRALGLADVASAGSVHEGTVPLRAAAVETKASQVMGMDVLGPSPGTDASIPSGDPVTRSDRPKSDLSRGTVAY
jgi:hypothetical protein